MTFLILDSIIGVVAFFLAVVPSAIIVWQDAHRGLGRPTSDLVVEAERVLVSAQPDTPTRVS